MSKNGILIVSFGTSHDDTRARTIDVLQSDFAAEFNETDIEFALSSAVILKILAKRGVALNNVNDAIEKLAKKGVTKLFVQPTYLICGEEYDKLKEQILQFSGKFDKILIGAPLLSSNLDICSVAEIISNETARDKDECLVLMGHGTAHAANAVYPAMDYVFKQLGYRDVFVGAVEGYPTVEIALKMASDSGYKKAVLAPLMLVAGDHAKNDMAGDAPDSWKNIANSMGFSVRCNVRGLGEIQKIREIYVEHLRDIMSK